MAPFREWAVPKDPEISISTTKASLTPNSMAPLPSIVMSQLLPSKSPAAITKPSKTSSKTVHRPLVSPLTPITANPLPGAANSASLTFTPPDAIPSTLYRVHYDRCHTNLSKSGVLSAQGYRGSSFPFEFFKKALHGHLIWKRDPSPFISLFSNERHARNWPLRRADPSVRVLKIYTDLATLAISKASNLIDNLNIPITELERHENEYLCVGPIGPQAIVELKNYERLLEDRQEAQSDEYANDYDSYYSHSEGGYYKEHSIYSDEYRYDSDWYDEDRFDEDGFDEDGFDEDGYDEDGFDRFGYDSDDRDRNGIDCNGFDEDGYDADGLDYRGSDQDGYDALGFNEDGFDCKGYNRKGYDEFGFNEDGHDRKGYDNDGFDEDGFHRDGYNEQWQHIIDFPEIYDCCYN